MSSQIKDEIYVLIQDKRFFDWVTKPSNELDNYWSDYLQKNPQLKSEIKEARTLVKAMAKKERQLTEEEIVQLWNKIEGSSATQKKKIFSISRWSVAASVFVILGLAGTAIYFLNDKMQEVDYSSIARLEPSKDDVTLFLSDSKKETFSSADVEIKYDENGDIITDTGKILNSDISEDNNNKKEQLNQLVVPFGKHSNIILSDGTKLWLNSGSRAIYPVSFNKKNREIFIEGEAYLEVAHNANQPFFVKTNDITVKVLGTKFNISAYPEDRLASVVLVEGSVEASSKKEDAIITPNQIFSLEKESGKVCVKKTDVMEYISWKEGWLLCNKEKIESIAAKLSRYYNVKIEILDKSVNDLTLTGKLDLKTECTDVINTISSTAPIVYQVVDDTHVRIISKR